MKNRIAMLAISLTIAVLAGLLPLLSRADDAAKTPTTAPSVAAATAPATQQAKACNTKCPVTKEPVDSSVATVDYKGKTVGFCCSDCIDTFKKNPEKYMADLK